MIAVIRVKLNVVVNSENNQFVLIKHNEIITQIAYLGSYKKAKWLYKILSVNSSK